MTPEPTQHAEDVWEDVTDYPALVVHLERRIAKLYKLVEDAINGASTEYLIERLSRIDGAEHGN